MCQWAGVLAGSAGLELTLLLGCTTGRGVLRKGSCGCAVEGQVCFCFGYAHIGVEGLLLGRCCGDRGQGCVGVVGECRYQLH